MAQKLDDNELVSFKELLMANSIQVDALAQLFIEKGYITKEEFFDKLKQVYAEYQSKQNSAVGNILAYLQIGLGQDILNKSQP